MIIERKNTDKPLLLASVGRSSYSFRAWSLESKKMINWAEIKKFGNLTKLISLNHIVVMQEIGFKNLYEGDIIEDNVGRGVVVYDQKRHKHIIRYSERSSKDFNSFLDSERRCIMKLGNVFENPELV